MIPRDTFSRWTGWWLFLAVAALLSAPVAWTASPQALILVDGICHAGSDSAPSPQDTPHSHDQCGLCQIGIGPALLAAAPVFARTFAWHAIAFVPGDAVSTAVSGYPAYASRAPPPPVGA
jgi:hypothetical protein